MGRGEVVHAVRHVPTAGFCAASVDTRAFF